MLMAVEEGKADTRSNPPVEQFKCIFEVLTGRKYVVIKRCPLIKALCS